MMSSNKKHPALTSHAPLPPQTRAHPAQAGKKVDITINLRNIPLLAHLTADEMAKVKAELRIRRYARREVVLQKGAGGDSLLFLLSGQMQVIDVTEDGRAIGLRMLSRGDFFGELAIINNSTRSASVVALSEALAASLPSATALHLFTHSPSVASQMLRNLAQKVQRDSEFRALLSINNTSKRIFNFLMLMQQKTPGKQDSVENLLTHQDIANMISTSRETVTRTLLTLAQQRIIQKDAHRLIIVNPEALQKLAQNP